MKKLLIIISILFTLIMVGALYGTQDRSEEKASVSIEEAFAHFFPNPMPDIRMHPMTRFSMR